MKLNQNNAIYAYVISPLNASGALLTKTELEELIVWVKSLLSEDVFDTSFSSQMYMHVGECSNYSMKNQVLQSLKVIYTHLNRNKTAVSEKKAIAGKLRERAAECSPGFHAGVNGILKGLYIARTFLELTQRVREDIVLNLATRSTNEVHTNNRFSIVAEELGYGVAPIHSEDSYQGDLDDNEIATLLKKEFNEKLRPFFMLKALEEQLRGQLSFLGYSEKGLIGYDSEVLEEITLYLKRFFSGYPPVAALKGAEANWQRLRAESYVLDTQITKKLRDFVEKNEAAFPTFKKQSAVKLLALKDLDKTHQRAPLVFQGWARQTVDALPKILKHDFDQLIHPQQKQRLASNLHDAYHACEQEKVAFESFFYVKNEEQLAERLNWTTGIRQLLWEGIKKEVYFEYTEKEEKLIRTLLNPDISEAVFQQAVVAYLSEPENFRDTAQLFSYFKCADSTFSEIATLLWESVKHESLLYELLFTSLIEKQHLFEQLNALFELPLQPFFMLMLSRNARILRYAPEAIRADEAAVWKAVISDGSALKYAAEALKNSFAIVLGAVKTNGLAIQYASERLRKDEEIAEAAFLQNPYALRYASRRFTIQAMHEPSALQYASETFRDDITVVSKALRFDADALQYASNRLRAHGPLVLQAVALDGRALKHVSPLLQANKIVVRAAVRCDRYGEALKYAAEPLKADKEVLIVCLNTWKSCHQNFRYAARSCLDDPVFMKRAIKKNSQIIRYVSDVLLDDPVFYDFLSLQLKRDTNLLSVASVRFKADKKLMLQLVAIDGNLLRQAEGELKQDMDLIRAAVRQNGTVIQYFQCLRESKVIALLAVAQNGEALRYATNILRRDREIVMCAVRQNGMALCYAHESLQADETIVLAAVMQNGAALLHATEVLRLSERVRFAAYVGHMRQAGRYVLGSSVGLAIQYPFVQLGKCCMTGYVCMAYIPVRVGQAVHIGFSVFRGRHHVAVGVSEEEHALTPQG